MEESLLRSTRDALDATRSSFTESSKFATKTFATESGFATKTFRTACVDSPGAEHQVEQRLDRL